MLDIGELAGIAALTIGGLIGLACTVLTIRDAWFFVLGAWDHRGDPHYRNPDEPRK